MSISICFYFNGTFKVCMPFRPASDVPAQLHLSARKKVVRNLRSIVDLCTCERNCIRTHQRYILRGWGHSIHIVWTINVKERTRFKGKKFTGIFSSLFIHLLDTNINRTSVSYSFVTSPESALFRDMLTDSLRRHLAVKDWVGEAVDLVVLLNAFVNNRRLPTNNKFFTKHVGLYRLITWDYETRLTIKLKLCKTDITKLFTSEIVGPMKTIFVWTLRTGTELLCSRSWWTNLQKCLLLLLQLMVDLCRLQPSYRSFLKRYLVWC